MVERRAAANKQRGDLGIAQPTEAGAMVGVGVGIGAGVEEEVEQVEVCGAGGVGGAAFQGLRERTGGDVIKGGGGKPFGAPGVVEFDVGRVCEGGMGLEEAVNSGDVRRLDGGYPCGAQGMMEFIDPGLEFRPGGEGIVAGEDELGIGQGDRKGGDGLGGKYRTVGVVVLEEGECDRIAGSESGQQVFRLLLEML